MKPSFHVSRFTHECPNWWVNFLRSLPLTKSDVYFYKIVNDHLKNWNAVYFDEVVNYPVVMFDTTKDASMFMLRWS